ncbi:SPFH domain-containing protein [Amnibacterium sp. CER49]|uniref:SPFH domain-containing protein n=1 Tax=Amnibacterium sp. CER49 TaxID=3039161 RepID=UPI0024493CAC|nr:SPFH domain-containing protein [Amnibacterium sp. CER49]MDH2442366.1 SPFH domain-containing protein [Amnibacterium sp. CER49]
MFAAALVFIVLAVVALLAGVALRRRERAAAAQRGPRASRFVLAGGGGLLGLGVLLTALSAFYAQDTGDASVVVSWTGDILGQEVAPGLHVKAPWSTVQTFNVRNQQVVFAGKRATTDYTGGSALGPDIVVQDADGVASDIDIAVRYSIRPDQVTTIYRQFRDETNFVSQFVTQDIRSTVRDAPNDFSTLQLITKRVAVNDAIQRALETRWKGTGVTVDSVSLQQITPPASVSGAYAAAQEAQIKVTTEQNNLKAAQVSAQQQVVQAEAKAKANDTLNRSLTANVLKQNYIDTLSRLAASGNVVVVPEGFGGIVNVK